MYTLHHGDCLDILPTLTGIHALVTDPPYGMNLLAKTGRIGSHTSKANIKGRIYEPVIGDNRPFDPTPFLMFQTVVLWGANWYANRLPASACWLVWDKRDGVNPNNMADVEMAWTNRNSPARMFHHRWMGMIRDSEKETEDRVHPTQKPVALMRWALDVMEIPQGATVCDPFMGSGSTGVACMLTGRKFIGIELDPNYFNIAKQRIENAARQMRKEFKPLADIRRYNDLPLLMGAD